MNKARYLLQVLTVLYFTAFAPNTYSSVIINTSLGSPLDSFSFTDNNIFTFNPPFAGTFETLNTEKTFSASTQMNHSVSVGGISDCHFNFSFSGCGIRWVETVTNNTGNAWSGYEISISGSTARLYDSQPLIPEFVEVVGTNVSGLITPNGWTVTQDANALNISLDFSSTPLLGTGDSFGLYFAIDTLTLGSSFTVSQQGIVDVFEPAPIALMGLGLGILGIYRRQQAS